MIVDMRNNQNCYVRNYETTLVTEACGVASIVGDLVTCSCATNTNIQKTNFSIINDFLYGTDLHLIGYTNFNMCTAAYDYYEVDPFGATCIY